MAYTDRYSIFGSGQSCAADATLADVVDLKAQADIGPGTTVYLCVLVKTSLDGASNNETYTVIFEESNAENFGSGVTEVLRTVMPRGTSKGTMFASGVPYGTKGRYLRARLVVGGTTPSGSIDVFLTGEAPPSGSDNAITPGVTGH